MTYDLAGRLTKKVTSDGVQVTYGYDASGRLLSETASVAVGKSAVTLYTQTYTYDAAGNRSGYVRTVPVARALLDVDLAKDIKAAILMAQLRQRISNVGYQTVYTYDASNRLQTAIKTIAANSKTYTLSTETYAYDAHGNRTTKTVRRSGKTDTVTAYTYDPLYQLTGVTTNGNAAATYAYNGNGQRVTSTEGRNTLTYVYDGSEAVIERNSARQTERVYTRTPGMPGGIGGLVSMTQYSDRDASTQTDEVDDGAPAAMAMTAPDSGTHPLYYHADVQGNVIGTTNNRGMPTSYLRYDAYGRTLAALGNADTHRYSSKELSPATGLYYFGSRWYDPSIGRWRTPDPMGFVDGMNRYAYVRNNPVNLVDPLGLCGERASLYQSLGFHLLNTRRTGIAHRASMRNRCFSCSTTFTDSAREHFSENTHPIVLLLLDKRIMEYTIPVYVSACLWGKHRNLR